MTIANTHVDMFEIEQRARQLRAEMVAEMFSNFGGWVKSLRVSGRVAHG